MLRIKANVKNFKVSYVPLKIYHDFLLRTEKGLLVPSEDMLDISSPEIIVFRRKDGDFIEYEERRTIYYTEKLTDNFRYVLSDFPDMRIKLASCEIIEKNVTPGGDSRKFLLLNLAEEHDYRANRDNVNVRACIDCENVVNPEGGKRCDGDYVVYNDYFLYEMGGTRNGEYNFGRSSLKNYATTVFYEDEGGKHVFEALIPCNLGGMDDTWKILLSGNEEDLENIALNPFLYVFYGKDERFFTEDTTFVENDVEYINLSLKPGVTVSWRAGDMRMSFPLSQSFDASMLQEEAVAQFVENKSQNAVNAIVDYEKQQFVPVFNGSDVSQITYKVHLRERESVDGVFEEWKTNDNLGWFNSTDTTMNSSGDSVYYMGFDGDDIYYQKKKVSETFLRVSLYDSVDRRRQKLLYTAKIYLNSASLYGQYVENVRSGMDDALSTIETEFICTHKYDYDNPTEGFYFHLFPSCLNEGETGRIFMKCELNNAKYGQTVPLVLFKEGFREGYMVMGASGVSVDMQAFYDDFYVPVDITRNVSGRYEWEFALQETSVFSVEEGKAVLNLFEPRING